MENILTNTSKKIKRYPIKNIVIRRLPINNLASLIPDYIDIILGTEHLFLR